MIYLGYFRQIKTDDLYTVKISTEGSTKLEEILLGGSPFVTEMDDSDKTIYTPAKYQTATIEIVSKGYKFDIYSPKAQGTKIELMKDNLVQWTGYATPNTYDLGFDSSLETILIECIDALSTLQYIKFLPSNKNVDSFINIIHLCPLKSFNNRLNYHLIRHLQAYTLRVLFNFVPLHGYSQKLHIVSTS